MSAERNGHMELDSCFNLAMRKSSRLITQFYEHKLSAVGLKSGQFSILRAIFHTKQSTNKELQTILMMDQTTLSRSIKPLFRDELIKFNPDPVDGRIKLISLTKAGRKLYGRALPIWEWAQQDICNILTDNEAEKINSLSESFVKTLGRK